MSLENGCGFRADMGDQLLEECARAEGWGVGEQERQIAWALMNVDGQERKVNFEDSETMAMPYEAFASWDEVGVCGGLC